jgi:hypothetical protein
MRKASECAAGTYLHDLVLLVEFFKAPLLYFNLVFVRLYLIRQTQHMRLHSRIVAAASGFGLDLLLESLILFPDLFDGLAARRHGQ